MSEVMSAGEFLDTMTEGCECFRNVTVVDSLYICPPQSIKTLYLSNVTFNDDLYLDDFPSESCCLDLENVTAKGEVFCGDNIALWLQCFSCFGPNGTPVHVNHQAIEKVLQALSKIPELVQA